MKQSGYNANGISDVVENAKNSGFEIGDQVKVTKVKGIPDCVGVISKKYTNSAMVKLHEGDKVTAQVMEEMNGRYVVNYDHLEKLVDAK
ncbi:hypothetical protein [Loigolactobacillus iwatensis]|uniref:hypothetical protein n=1 Tax=Loigolactobacillus iwatensis TaxID=1267156 RepID=UPI001CDBA895|nr:hypothetical protein [Loigolactobacillus iwatensis]